MTHCYYNSEGEKIIETTEDRIFYIRELVKNIRKEVTEIAERRIHPEEIDYFTEVLKAELKFVYQGI